MAQPNYSSAASYIGEQTIALTFDVALDAGHPPPTSAFDVQVNGLGVGVAGLSVDGPGKTVTVTLSVGALTAGDIIEVVYTDPSGGNDISAIQGTDGVDAASFSKSTIVATARPVPSAPPAPALDPGSDSGTIGDGITSDNTPTISGTAGANATVKLYDTDGTTLLGNTTADGSGTYSITSSALTSGAHTLKVTQTDGSNATSPLSTGLALTIDTAAAAPSGISVAAGSDSGTLGDGISNATTPAIRGGNGSAEAGATVKLYDTDGTTLLGTTTANGSGAWSISSTNLIEGSHTLTAKQTDVAGNVSAASAGFTYVVDTVGPSQIGLNALSTTSASVAQTAATNGSTIATLVSNDLTAVTYGFAIGNGTIDADNGKFTISGTSLVASQNLTSGSYHLYLSGTDAAGNQSYQIFNLNVTNAPTVTSIVRAGAASATVPSSATSVSYTVTFSSAVTGVDASDFVLTLTGNASGTIDSVSGSGTTYTVQVSQLAGDGTLRLDLNSSGTGIQDGSSNPILTGYSTGQSFTLDHTAPSAPSVPSLATASDTGASSSDGTTSVTTPSFSGHAEANSTVRLYDTDGTTLLATTTADGAGAWSATTSPLSAGSHSITAKSVDAAANSSTASAATTVFVDASAPTLTSALANGNSLTLSYADASMLDAAHGPANGAFSVLVGGVVDAVTAVAINASAKTATLTLATAVTAGQTVTLGYTDPTAGDDANAIQDVAGNDAATVVGFAVTNATPAPGGGGSTAGVNLTAPATGGVLSGTSGNDILTGLQGMDIFNASGGRDVIDGGPSKDTVVFTGARADYTIGHNADGTFTVMLNSDSGAVTSLTNIERLTFRDQSVALDVTPATAKIDNIYTVAFGRSPEDPGLSYWASQGLSTAQLANDFIRNPEFVKTYGQLGDVDLITTFYQNAFNRAPDTAGMAYYKDLLATHPGVEGRATLLADILASPEMQAKLVGQIDQGLPLL